MDNIFSCSNLTQNITIKRTSNTFQVLWSNSRGNGQIEKEINEHVTKMGIIFNHKYICVDVGL